MCLDEEHERDLYDEDGIFRDPLEPVPYDARWEERGRAPVPGLQAFGPVSREDRTPHNGTQGLQQAIRKLTFHEKRRKRGWSLLWRGHEYDVGRCIRINLRLTDDEGGARVLRSLTRALRELGFMVQRLRPAPVDPQRYRPAERIA